MVNAHFHSHSDLSFSSFVFGEKSVLFRGMEDAFCFGGEEDGGAWCWCSLSNSNHDASQMSSEGFGRVLFDFFACSCRGVLPTSRGCGGSWSKEIVAVENIRAKSGAVVGPGWPRSPTPPVETAPCASPAVSPNPWESAPPDHDRIAPRHPPDFFPTFFEQKKILSSSPSNPTYQIHWSIDWLIGSHLVSELFLIFLHSNVFPSIRMCCVSRSILPLLPLLPFLFLIFDFFAKFSAIFDFFAFYNVPISWVVYDIAAFQQKTDHLLVAFRGGQVKGCASVVIWLIHVQSFEVQPKHKKWAKKWFPRERNGRHRIKIRGHPKMTSARGWEGRGPGSWYRMLTSFLDGPWRKMQDGPSQGDNVTGRGAKQQRDHSQSLGLRFDVPRVGLLLRLPNIVEVVEIETRNKFLPKKTVKTFTKKMQKKLIKKGIKNSRTSQKSTPRTLLP